MAFSYSVTQKPIAMGNMRIAFGTFTQGNGDTGGDIVTGMRDCRTLVCNAALSTSISAGTVTITTADPGAAQTAHWVAFGY